MHMNLTEARAATLSKLEKSGLRAHIELLRLKIYSSDTAKNLNLMISGAGFQIPYFDFSKNTTDFWRYRFVEDSRNSWQKAASIKQTKYLQPAGSGCAAYFPPFTNWESILQNTHTEIYITEGELKAASSSLQGWPTIGLGGVWGFKNSKAGHSLLPELRAFSWKSREVKIIFDSDVIHNPHIANAENTLARELLKLGALVSIVRLPELATGDKTGLDDLIVSTGKDQALETIESNSSLFSAVEILHQLNSEVIYVRNPGLVVTAATKQKMTPRAFVDHAYANRVWIDTVISPKGTARAIQKSAAAEWLHWAMRTEVQGITFSPGNEEFVNGDINTWKGWGVEPIQGDVTPWRLLLNFLFKDKVKELKWFEQWLAYPIQYPGYKLYTAVLIWGLAHGTGKTLIGDSLIKIYGENGASIGNKELHSSFNDWAECRQFVVGDEIVGGDTRHFAEALKSMITQQYVRINAKFLPSYTLPDTINYYFTSQKPRALPIDEPDRRYFVHEVVGPPNELQFYLDYVAWLNDKGASYLFYHLKNLNTDYFQPAAPAMMTQAKLDMIQHNKTELATWVGVLKEAPEEVLRMGGKAYPYAIWTGEELRTMYDPNHRTKITATTFGRELKKHGFLQVGEGKSLRTKLGHKRMWIIKNPNAYPTAEAAIAQYEKERE